MMDKKIIKDDNMLDFVLKKEGENLMFNIENNSDDDIRINKMIFRYNKKASSDMMDLIGYLTNFTDEKSVKIINYEPLIPNKVILHSRNVGGPYNVYKIRVMETEYGRNFINNFEEAVVRIVYQKRHEKNCFRTKEVQLRHK